MAEKSSVQKARRAARCSLNKGYPLFKRASVVTHWLGYFSPPKAGFFCAVAASRCLSDTPHRMAQRDAATAQKNSGQMGPYHRRLV